MSCRYCGVAGNQNHIKGCARPRRRHRPRRRYSSGESAFRFQATGAGAYHCLYCERPGLKTPIGLCDGCQAELDAAKASPGYARIHGQTHT